MLKITIILLSSVISAVILQQAPNTYPDNPVIYPYQILRTKPCNRRFNAPFSEDQWVPNPPQSLTQNSFIEQSPFLSPDDLLRDNRRANGEEEPTASDLGSKSSNKDCDDDDHNCDDNGVTTAVDTNVIRGKNEPLTSGEIEQRTIQMLKDCLTDKKLKSGVSVDTRRSLTDDENHYSRDASSEESNAVQDTASRFGTDSMGRNNKILLMNNPRVCYACSSASNPSCWKPDKRTTIKYCNRDHASCVTKTFGVGASLTVIRDCASSCSDSPIPGIEPRYKKCSVCHSDLCNSAYSIKSYTVLYVLLIFTGLKFAF